MSLPNAGHLLPGAQCFSPVRRTFQKISEELGSRSSGVPNAGRYDVETAPRLVAYLGTPDPGSDAIGMKSHFMNDSGTSGYGAPFLSPYSGRAFLSRFIMIPLPLQYLARK